MQALKERISSKLSEKSKSKDKDGSSALKTSSSVDGKHSTSQDSHQSGATASSASASSGASAAPAASSTAIHIQSAEKGIGISRMRKDNKPAHRVSINLSLCSLFDRQFFLSLVVVLEIEP